MIVIKHNLTGERFNYHEQPVNDFPDPNKQPLPYVIPKNFSLDTDQTPADQFLTHLVNEEMGQYVDTVRHPSDNDPLKIENKWDW